MNGFVDVPKAEKLFREANFPFAVGVILLKHPWEFIDGETLPDIFHPDYAQLIQSRAAQICPRYKDDPLCMGYYYGFGAFNKSDEWVNHHFSLPQGSPGREVLSDLLIKRYGNDVAKFQRLGSFIKEWALSVDSWKKAAPYVDMIAPQHLNEYISVSDISSSTGLPIIFSDEYFGFHYPGKTGSLHAGLVSHDARGEVYHANLMRHYKDPNVMGVTYCACMYDQGGNTLAKNNQNGFYSLDGTPRKRLIEVVRKLNGEVYQHATKPASPEELEALHTELFGKWKEHSVRRGR